jgi:hypothetical protein
MKTRKKTNPPPGDDARTTAEEILAAIEMARSEEQSVDVTGLDMGQVKKLLRNLLYTFQESRDGKQIIINFPQRLETGKPVPPGTKPKYQINIH